MEAQGRNLLPTNKMPMMRPLPKNTVLWDDFVIGTFNKNTLFALRATSIWGHLSAWQEEARIDFTNGIQAKLIINEPLEAISAGRQPSEYAKVFFDLCPHSTPGHFNINKDEMTMQKFQVTHTLSLIHI